jgi:hypothetical protein
MVTIARINAWDQQRSDATALYRRQQGALGQPRPILLAVEAIFLVPYVATLGQHKLFSKFFMSLSLCFSVQKWCVHVLMPRRAYGFVPLAHS